MSQSQASSIFRHLARVVPSAFRAQPAAARTLPAKLPTMEGEYSSTVVRSAEPGLMPKDGADKIHHVVKGGRVTGFKNPYPSWGTGTGVAEILRAVIW